jgi:hypothetical protein
VSTDTAGTTPRRGRRKKEKKNLWQTDLSSLGKKGEPDADEVIEHEPFVATLPQVNLLPAAITESMALRRIRNILVLAIVLLLLVVGGIWWLQGSTIAKAESDLAAATTQNAKIRKDLEALGPVKQMYDQITSLQGVVTTTLASQPQASLVLERLAQAGAAAGGARAIEFMTADVVYNGIPVAGEALNDCPNPDPFGADITIGCITFSATAKNREQVASLLRELESDPLFVGPYVTSTTTSEVSGNGGGPVVSFSGSAGVSLDALKTQLTPEQVAAITTPPEPEPSPSASGEAGDQ